MLYLLVKARCDMVDGLLFIFFQIFVKIPFGNQAKIIVHVKCFQIPYYGFLRRILTLSSEKYLGICMDKRPDRHADRRSL